MPQNASQVRIRGLSTYDSDFTQGEPDYLSDCNNIVINKNNVAEPRRGLPIYGTSMGVSPTEDTAHQLLIYKERILRHFGSGPGTTIDFDNGSGNFASFSGTYSEVDEGLRIKYIEQNGNLYFTTSNGIKKISAATANDLPTTTVTDAGGVKALDLDGTVDYSQTGFFTQDSTVAYRVVWGIKDPNANLILGFPSARFVLENELMGLLIKDTNNLLHSIDLASAANAGGTLSETNYLDIFKLGSNSSAQDEFAVLTGLCTKLDNDIYGTVTNVNIAALIKTALDSTPYFSTVDNGDGTLTITNSTPGASNTPTSSVQNAGFGITISDAASSEVTQITTIAGSAYATTGTADYLDIFSGGNATQYRVWFSTVGVSVPSSVGVALIKIPIAGTETSSDVANLIQTALSSTNDFTVPAPVGQVLTVTANLQGATNASVSHVVDSGFIVSESIAGNNQVEDLSAIAGNDFTQTGTADYFDIYASQNVVQYRIWFNAGTTTAPDSNGATLIEITVPGTQYQGLAAEHTNPGTSPTSAQLLDLQSLYDQIVDQLLNESIAHITVAAQTAGNFQNSTQSAAVNLRFTIPSEIVDDSWFYQVYRTAVFQSTGVGQLSQLDPGDEEGLVYEANTTADERAAGEVIYTDVVPESFRGANLYTNPQSGQGIAQANEVPPLAKDITTFKNSTFYANTRTKHIYLISMLGIANLVSGISSISIIQDNTVNTYTFVSPVAQVTEVTAVSGANYVTTGTADYFDVYAGLNTTQYRIWFNAGTVTAPSGTGVTLVEISVTGVETDIEMAQKIYESLNEFNDFNMISPSTATLTITNDQSGITTNGTSHVSDTDFTVITTTEGSGENPSTNSVLLSDAQTPAQQVDETARSLIKVINKNQSEVINAFYLSGPQDVPGQMQFETRQLGTDPFYIIANDSVTGQSFSPILTPSNSITNISVANPTVITSASHGLSTGAKIVISGSNSTPTINGVRTITKIDNNTFTVPVAVTVAGTAGVWSTTTNAQTSDNQVAPNRIYFSKDQQPEAVPIVNYFDVGPKDKAIVRIIPLRDSLFVLKEDAVWSVTGDSAENGFSVSLFDSSVFIAAADSCAVLNNQIYLFSSQGIVVVTETGISVVSRVIEDQLLPLLDDTNFKTATFGCSYESDRAYMIWTTAQSDDDFATQCFRYNSFTETWTKWLIGKRSGAILNERLYLGPTDTNFIEQERKSFDRTDYADRQIATTITEGNVFETIIKLGTLNNISIGDAFFQEQYLTIYKFNQLLKKLDDDQGTADKDYESLLNAVPGTNLRNSLTDLADKLDNDTGVNESDFASSISGFGTSFLDMQNAFNTIINLLNTNSGLVFNNYPTSTGTVRYEATIVDLNEANQTITLEFTLPLITGNASTFEHIPVSITFRPQYFSDPELFKQVSEAKFIFDRTNFTRATISYSTDLSPAFEEYDFIKQGNGSFGNQIFGETNFGGNADKTPIRTLVPRNKQRCQFLVPKIDHAIARERMGVIGYSMFYSAYSQRSYTK